MNRDRTLVGGVVLLGIGVLVIGAIWYFVLRPPEEASAPIESIPLELAEEATAVPNPTQTPASAAAEEEKAAAESAGEEMIDEEAVGEEPGDAEIAGEEASAEEGSSAEEAASETAGDANDTGAGIILYEISQGNSEVRFILNEELRGQPTTVIGVSNQVAGQIAADANDLSSTQVGVILINARTFFTDNEFRNNAIQNRILNTNQFEFIEFTPTAVTGLPDRAEIGETVTFEIVGDLTIRDITNEVTFAVSAMVTEVGQLQGSATTQVLRSDYNLQIPSVPNVANVTDEVRLEIDFLANVIEP